VSESEENKTKQKQPHLFRHPTFLVDEQNTNRSNYRTCVNLLNDIPDVCCFNCLTEIQSNYLIVWVWTSGICRCWPDCLELCARGHAGSGGF